MDHFEYSYIYQSHICSQLCFRHFCFIGYDFYIKILIFTLKPCQFNETTSKNHMVLSTKFCFEAGLLGACYPVKQGPRASLQQRGQKTKTKSHRMPPLSYLPKSPQRGLFVQRENSSVCAGGGHKVTHF